MLYQSHTLRFSPFRAKLVSFTTSKLPGACHPPHRLNGLTHRHLGSFSMFLTHFLVLLTSSFDIIMKPLKDVRHVEVVFHHPRPIRNAIRNQSPSRLVEVNLAKHPTSA